MSSCGAPPEVAELHCRVFELVTCVVVMGSACVFGLAGNIVSLMVLRRHASDAAAVRLLQGLALSDSVLLATTLLVYSLPAAYAFTGRPPPACRYLTTLAWPVCMTAHTTTIYLTLLVTFNRYTAICRPVHNYRAQSGNTAVRLVLLTAVCAVLYNLPRFFEHQPLAGSGSADGHNARGNGTGLQGGVQLLGDSVVYQVVYSNIVYYPVMYVLPLVGLAFLNARLIHCLRELRRRKSGLTSRSLRARRDDHITLSVVVIVCVFICCQTPALINQVFWAALPSERRLCGHFHYYYTRLSDLLVVLNSSCNLVIYCLCARRFRASFLQTLLCCYSVRLDPNTGPETTALASRPPIDTRAAPAPDATALAPLPPTYTRAAASGSVDATAPNIDLVADT